MMVVGKRVNQLWKNGAKKKDRNGALVAEPCEQGGGQVMDYYK
jgi:hypothetical protein